MTTTAADARNVRVALLTLKDLSGYSDKKLAQLAGFPNHQYVEARRSGHTPISLADMQAFAEAFGVPLELFLRPRADVLRYIADNDLFPPGGSPLSAWEDILRKAS